MVLRLSGAIGVRRVRLVRCVCVHRSIRMLIAGPSQLGAASISGAFACAGMRSWDFMVLCGQPGGLVLYRMVVHACVHRSILMRAAGPMTIGAASVNAARMCVWIRSWDVVTMHSMFDFLYECLQSSENLCPYSARLPLGGLLLCFDCPGREV